VISTGDGCDGLIHHVGTYKTYANTVVQKDDNTIITGGIVVKLWNITTCDCLSSIAMPSAVGRMMRTKDQSNIVIGLGDGTIEIWRTSDLSTVWRSTQIHSDFVVSICEIHDGTFVTATEKEFKRWGEERQVLQTFNTNGVLQVVECEPNIIVSASRESVKIWNLLSQECLHNILSTDHAPIVALEEGMFVTSWNRKITLWSVEGELIETIGDVSDTSCFGMGIMRLRDGSLGIGAKFRIEIRKLLVINAIFF